MSEDREPTQAMPKSKDEAEKPRPTQPIDGHPRAHPKKDDEGFGGFMGHGGQTDFAYEGPNSEEDGEGDNPNAAADVD